MQDNAETRLYTPRDSRGMLLILKEGVSAEDIPKLHSALIYTINQIDMYGLIHGFDIVWTSFISDRKHLENVTEVHGQGRGADFRKWNIPEFHRARLVMKVNTELNNIGALSGRSGEQVILLEEKDHFHLQVSADAPLIDLIVIN